MDLRKVRKMERTLAFTYVKAERDMITVSGIFNIPPEQLEGVPEARYDTMVKTARKSWNKIMGNPEVVLAITNDEFPDSTPMSRFDILDLDLD